MTGFPPLSRCTYLWPWPVYSCHRLPPVSPGRYLPADQQQTSVYLHLPGGQSYLGQAECPKTTRKFWWMLCLFSRMNVSFPALHLAYATRLLANHAAGWAGCLQLQICFLLTCAIHELAPIMVREASLHRIGKIQTYAEIHCMLPLLLLLQQAWCPHHNNSHSYLNGSHPPVQDGQSAALHLPLSLESRQLQRSHLFFHLFFENSPWLSGLREQLLKNKPFHGIECASPFYLTCLQKDD